MARSLFSRRSSDSSPFSLGTLDIGFSVALPVPSDVAAEVTARWRHTPVDRAYFDEHFGSLTLDAGGLNARLAVREPYLSRLVAAMVQLEDTTVTAARTSQGLVLWCTSASYQYVVAVTGLLFLSSPQG